MADQQPWVAAGCPQEVYSSLASAFNAEQALALCKTIASTALANRKLLQADPPAYAAETDLDALTDTVQGISDGLNAAWLVLTGALVFLMHGGFAMLCAGAIRSKNTLNILLQTILDACVSGICFYTVGYAFAYGQSGTGNKFIGNSLFGLRHWIDDPSGGGGFGTSWQQWFYQWAFAATATTIPAGAVAERFNFNAYLSYTVLVSAFVYPVIVHWVWDDNGWLGAARVDGDLLFGSGMIDFAGCGVVHMVGGLTGLMGAWLVGPRLGRFDSNGNPVDMPGHSATLVVLGTVLLWFGWYGFNPGSTLYINTTTAARVASRCAVTTTLSGCGGGLSCLFNGFRRTKQWDLCALCNGALVGFVCITAGCHVLEPWAAILAGFTGGLIFDGACWVWLKLRIDDPLSASPMHGVCGAWGLIMVGFLAKEEYVMESYSANRRPYYGCFYPGGKGHLLAAQLIGILSIIAWVCGLTGILFATLKFFGKLRISEEDEHRGLDASKHGGSAYNTDGMKPGNTTPQLKA